MADALDQVPLGTVEQTVTAPTPGQAEPEQTTEQDPDAEGEAVTPTPEDVEVDYEGAKFKVPLALKDALLRQADYTRKTQEVAETRKSLETREAEFNQRTKDHMDNLKDVSRLVALDERLDAYKKLDWESLRNSDPLRSQELFQQYQLLKDERTEIAGSLSAKSQQAAIEQQRETAKKLEQANVELAKEIPNWSPDTAKKLFDFGAKELGFTQHELSGITDKRVVMALHLAWIGQQLTAKQRAATAAQKTVAEPVSQVGGKATPRPGVRDDMSTDAWMKQRMKQVASA